MTRGKSELIKCLTTKIWLIIVVIVINWIEPPLLLLLVKIIIIITGLLLHSAHQGSIVLWWLHYGLTLCSLTSMPLWYWCNFWSTFVNKTHQLCNSEISNNVCGTVARSHWCLFWAFLSVECVAFVSAVYVDPSIDRVTVDSSPT